MLPCLKNAWNVAGKRDGGATAAISKLVRHPDMKVSTLRDLIEAMSGELHITATFSDRSVEIGNFTAVA